MQRVFKDKLKLVDDYKITKDMFSDEPHAHQTLKQLMAKFEEM
jgi:hypothetical protein